jgi:hypothetical protein
LSKNICFWVNQTIKNNLIYQFLFKFPTYHNKELQGIPKELMIITLVQNNDHNSGSKHLQLQ